MLMCGQAGKKDKCAINSNSVMNGAIIITVEIIALQWH